MIIKLALLALLVSGSATHAQASSSIRTTGAVAAENLLQSPRLSRRLREIFSQDQSDRRDGADWRKVTERDLARRKDLKDLISVGGLKSGEDYEAAAFIFQHGSSSNDYLLAHTLAVVSVSKGRRDAVWICAATLDRYLSSERQPQIFGTQYITDPGKKTTQEPYDKDLISDALRKELRVPRQDEQRALLGRMIASSH